MKYNQTEWNEMITYMRELEKQVQAYKMENQKLHAQIERGKKMRGEKGQFQNKDGHTKTEKVHAAYRMYAKGHSYEAIAKYVCVSPSTAKRYVYLAKQELNARNGHYENRGKDRRDV